MKTIHMADKVNERGGVSAKCFERPRAIDLKRSTWTLRLEAITCRKCLRTIGTSPVTKTKDEKRSD